MAATHTYQVSITWTGDRGTGTSDYRSYGRDHDVSTRDGAQVLLGSADPSFRGDETRWNPEQLLVASLAQCHMLWFLHLCSDARIVVTAYTDEPTGTMTQTPDGGGRFTEVALHPAVTLADPSRAAELAPLHHRAHELCFIANSINFPVTVTPA